MEPSKARVLQLRQYIVAAVYVQYIYTLVVNIKNEESENEKKKFFRFICVVVGRAHGKIYS